jgi:hypothetical protein
VYRDNPLELDSLCRQLLREAPGHLEDGGRLQMLCESVEIEGEAWQDRMQSWVNGTGCDTWLLHNPPVPPATYVGRRAADVVEASGAAAAGDDEWLDYFASQQVTAIHPGLFVLRRRDGDNWLHVHNLPGDVTRPAGDAVRRGIAACDFLERCRDDAALLEARVAIAPQLTLEQQFARTEDNWRPRMSLLRMDDGLGMDAEVDLPVLAFVNQLDGAATVRECIERFATSVGAGFDRLAADLLPVVRLFVGRGFLVPAAEAGRS